ncbi:MAG: hypothetical protein QF645_07005 [Planctomycetota bacterium]|nr:hypothetical protein [Planctomycetota bacterium]
MSEDPIPNRHEVTLNWFRTQLDINRSIGKGWDVELQLPYDVKSQSVKYLTPEGNEFDNPEGDLHHRDETLQGMGDIKIFFHYRPTNVLREEDIVQLGFGLSAPTGKIEEDPYELGDLGLKHQHIQFGTGTVDPIFRLGYSTPVGKWNLSLSAGGQIPLYENRKHFKSPMLLDFSAGAHIGLTESVGLHARYVLMYQNRGHWHDEIDPNTGFLLHGLSVSTPIQVAEGILLTPRAFFTLDVDTKGVDDTFRMDVLVGIGLEINLDKENPPEIEFPEDP